MFGFKVAGLPEIFGEAVVISDVTQHGAPFRCSRLKYSCTCPRTCRLLSVPPALNIESSLDQQFYQYSEINGSLHIVRDWSILFDPPFGRSVVARFNVNCSAYTQSYACGR